MFQQLPQGMFAACGHLAAQPHRDPLHGAIEADVRLLEVEELHQLRPQRVVIDHRHTSPMPLKARTTADASQSSNPQIPKIPKSPNPRIHRTRIRSDRVMMNVLSVLKSRTSTAGFCGVIIVCSRSTGVETSTKGKAGCMIVSTGCDLMSAF